MDTICTPAKPASPRNTLPRHRPGRGPAPWPAAWGAGGGMATELRDPCPAGTQCAAGVCGRDAFLAAAQGAEGFLFPETYLFEPGTPAPAVIRAGRDRFAAVWEEVFRAAQAAA